MAARGSWCGIVLSGLCAAACVLPVPPPMMPSSAPAPAAPSPTAPTPAAPVGPAGTEPTADRRMMALERPAPVRVDGFDGVVEVSHGGGITCARDSSEHVRCFGRSGSTVIEPRALQLPEPIDSMVGGNPLCVRGRDSHAFYCRDPLQSSFRGTLPDHFTPLIDSQGRTLGNSVVSVAVDVGVGIRVALRDGRTGTFLYSGTLESLRIDMSRGHTEKMREVLPGGGVRADGRGEIRLGNNVVLTAIPVLGIVTVADLLCFLDEEHQLHCFHDGDGSIRVIATNVVSIDSFGNALGANGDVLALALVDRGVEARRREGLPPMAQLAGPCGRSVAGQLWCWGAVELLGPPHRPEPGAVAFEP